MEYSMVTNAYVMLKRKRCMMEYALGFVVIMDYSMVTHISTM